MENIETKLEEQVTKTEDVVEETTVVEETKQEEVETTENIETPAETTEETAEEVVVENETTETPTETKEQIEPVKVDVDKALQEKLEAQVKEIENLKKEMAKLRKANEFTSTDGSHQQNNKGGVSYSDGDINNFRWKI